MMQWELLISSSRIFLKCTLYGLVGRIGSILQDFDHLRFEKKVVDAHEICCHNDVQCTTTKLDILWGDNGIWFMVLVLILTDIEPYNFVENSFFVS